MADIPELPNDIIDHIITLARKLEFQPILDELDELFFDFGFTPTGMCDNAYDEYNDGDYVDYINMPNGRVSIDAYDEYEYGYDYRYCEDRYNYRWLL